MEQWEIELREKLEKEVPNGIYNLSTDDVTLATGKGGYIMFEVELQRELRKYMKITQDDEKE